MKAIDNFDLSHQVKFSTYAVPMIIGEVRRFLRDNNSIRVSRSLRDIAYKTVSAREALTRELDREPTLDEIAERTSISREEIIQSLDAIQSPLSLYEPIYSDGGDTLYVMDQISDKKNKEDNWVQEIALCEALKSSLSGSSASSKCVFMRERLRWRLRRKYTFLRRRSLALKKVP